MGMTGNGANGLALFILLTVLYITKYIYTTLTNPLNKVPGPWYSQWTNLRLKAATLTGRRIHYVHALHAQYGPYVRLSPYEIGVNDVAGFKQVHSFTKPWNKSPWYARLIQQQRPVLFSMGDAKPHAVRRKMFARSFSKSHIREHWEVEVARTVKAAAERIYGEASESGVADVLKWWTFMASDVAAHLMFGESFRTLEAGTKSPFVQVLEKVLMGNGIGAELPLLRFVGKRLPIKLMQDVFNPHELIWGYAQAAVTGMKAKDGKQNIFANIMAEAGKSERLDDIDVKCEAMGLIIAGTDTTAITLTYFVWAVLSHPEIQSALEKEVATLSEDYTDADIEKLPFLTAALEETLRLYGAAPGMLPRMVPAGGVQMNDYFIPAGTTAITQSYSLHRDPELFPEPLEFKPERWLPETTNKFKVSEAARAIYSPFGAGTRTCIGVHIANMELRYGSVAFLRKCVGAKLAPSATAECMAQQNYQLTQPAGHMCEITL